MHDPKLRHTALFDEEQSRIESGRSVSECVIQTVKQLRKTAEQALNLTDKVELLRSLGLRDRPFHPANDAFTAREVVRAGYELVYSYYWLQHQREYRKTSRLYQFLSQFFAYGVSEPLSENDKGILFAVYAQPRCPVISAYKGHTMCGEGCKERSRLGFFTNPELSLLLSFYHKDLKLRLYHFRSKKSEPCIYQLVYEN